MSTKTLLTGTAVGGALVLATAVATTALSARSVSEPLQASAGCYVPTSGTVYVIGVPGAPTSCRQGHTPITLQGPAGPQGVQGPPGPAGLSGLAAYTRKSVTNSIGPGVFNAIRASCDPGDRAINGGYRYFGADADVDIVSSLPTTTGAPNVGPSTSWEVGFVNRGTANVQIEAYVQRVPGGA